MNSTFVMLLLLLSIAMGVIKVAAQSTVLVVFDNDLMNDLLNDILRATENSPPPMDPLLDDTLLSEPAPSLSTDRNYTMGLAFDFSGDILDNTGFRQSKEWLLKPVLLVQKLPLLNCIQDTINVSYALQIGSSNFTPDKIQTRKPLHNDRPYSSLLYLFASKTNYINNRFLVYQSFTVGLLGLPIAEYTQTFLHRMVRRFEKDDPNDPASEPHDPLGWDNQISDGGEPTARYLLSVKKRFFGSGGTIGDSIRSDFDLRFNTDLSLGYYTYWSAGVAGRIGFLNDSWEFVGPAPTDGNTRVEVPPIQTAGSEEIPLSPFANYDRRNSYYIWFSARAIRMLYNVHLQGQFRNSAVTFDSPEIRKWIYEFEAGITFHTNKVPLSLSIATRSPDLRNEGARLGKQHTWGRILFGLRFGG